jgi:hypothetical protein
VAYELTARERADAEENGFVLLNNC